MTENKLDISKVIESGLSFDAYLILYCLHKNNEELLVAYITKCNKINLSVFHQLTTDGYISMVDSTEVYFHTIELTKKGELLFDSQNGCMPSGDVDFEEFRNNYPAVVKEGYKVRRLHSNLKRCKQLYSKLLEETTHDVLCKCARLYAKEAERSGSKMYMKALETWLNQRDYQQYLNDVEVPEMEGGFSHDI